MNEKFVIYVFLLCSCLDGLKAEEESDGKEKSPQKPLAILDIENSKEGSCPGGATPKKGQWFVDAEAKKLKVAFEPLVEGWLEYGPEIREKGATAQGSGRAPAERRIQSRFGIGLYGVNGFQLRLVVGRDEIEVVRRGEVLQTASMSLEESEMYELELSVVEDKEDWRVIGRVWKEEGDRPDVPSIELKFPEEALLFPLAGRPVLVATPFSGQSVMFASARVFEGLVEPIEEVQEKAEECNDSQ